MNGPLQQRTWVLNSDRVWANRLPSDYETDSEVHEEVQSAFSSSLETRNLFEQNQLASTLNKQMNEMVLLATRALNIHLNVEQHFAVNSPTVFISSDRLTSESLSNKEISMVGKAFVRLLPTLNNSLSNTSSLSLLSCLPGLISMLLSSPLWNDCLSPVDLWYRRWICLDRFHCH